MAQNKDVVFEFYRTALDMSDVISLVDILGPSRYVPDTQATPVEDLALYFRGRNDTVQLDEYSCDTLLSTNEDEQLILDALVIVGWEHTNIVLEVKDTTAYGMDDVSVSPIGAGLRIHTATRGFASTITVLKPGERPTLDLPDTSDDPSVATFLAHPEATIWQKTHLRVDPTLIIEPGKGMFPRDTIPHLPEGFKQVSWTGSQGWEVSTCHSVHGDIYGTDTRALAAAVLQTQEHSSAVMAVW